MLANGEPYRVHGTINCVPHSHPDLLDVGHRHWYGERHEAVTGRPDLKRPLGLLQAGVSRDLPTDRYPREVWVVLVREEGSGVMPSCMTSPVR